MKDEIVMYLIARKDLKMSTGKFGAQIGHGVQYALTRLLYTDEQLKWRAEWDAPHSTKIVLAAESREQLIQLMESIPFQTALVIDEGRTELAQKTETVLALIPVPKSVAKPYVGHLPLY